jgi:hypothetical protein
VEKQWRLDVEQRRLKDEESRRRREEKPQLRREEAERVRALEHEVASWHKIQQMRKYLCVLREAATKKHGSINPDRDLGRWLKWAEWQADRFDPLVNAPPSILDEEEE